MTPKFIMKIVFLASICFRGAAIIHIGQSKTNETITTTGTCAFPDTKWQETKKRATPEYLGTCQYFPCRGWNTCCSTSLAVPKCFCLNGYFAAGSRNCAPAPPEEIRGTKEYVEYAAARRQTVSTISSAYGLASLDWTAVNVDELLAAIIPSDQNAVAQGEITDVRFFKAAPGGAEVEIVKGVGEWKNDVLNHDASYAKIYAKASWKNTKVETETEISSTMLASVAVGGEAKLAAGELWEIFATMKFGAEIGVAGKMDVNGITASLTCLVTASVEVKFANVEGFSIAGTADAGGKLDFAATFDWKNGKMEIGAEAFAGAKAEGQIKLRWIVFKASARVGAGATAKLEVKDGVAGAELGATLGAGGTLGIDVCFVQIEKDIVSALNWVAGDIPSVYTTIQYSNKEEMTKLNPQDLLVVAQLAMKMLPEPVQDKLAPEQRAALTLALAAQTRDGVNKILKDHPLVKAQLERSKQVVAVA